jgi:AAA15 family ATPase/GTPase
LTPIPLDKVTDKRVGQKTAKELKEFFDKDDFEKVKIELINLLHPFSNSFFALRNDNDLTQVTVRNLGSGIEIVLTLLILKNIAGASKGSIIYLIDEPELHLHPKAQKKLLDLLLEESKDKQIIISTHSPYLFKGAISQNATLLLFTRYNEDHIQITDPRDRGWGLFPNWSPSWGEINYFAYDMPTVEFHNELYGYIESEMQKKLESLDKDRQRKNLKTGKEENVSLPEYIRHAIHHPENRENKEYSDEEFRESINTMIKLIRS